jgi:hypothetical protein
MARGNPLVGFSVRQGHDENPLAEVPDGEVVAVERAAIRERPTDIHPPAIPAPPECKPNVPV